MVLSPSIGKLYLTYSIDNPGDGAPDPIVEYHIYICQSSILGEGSSHGPSESYVHKEFKNTTLDINVRIEKER